MNNPSPRFTRILLLSAALAASTGMSFGATTNTLLNFNFNSTNETYPAWGSTALTGVPGAGVYTLNPSTNWNTNFPTAPTSGYLVLAPNAAAVNSNTYYGGWAANTTLGTINSLYTAGGFGTTNLAKVKLTAKVRARGMPSPNGAVVILKLQASGDNPGSVPGGYKRIMFEPTLLAGNDWTTIGGTFDTAGLSTASGTSYTFPTNAAAYSVLVELSGFNRFGTTGYVAYNSPTIPAAGGRKNPGFDLSASNIRVEVDDVQLTVVDPATNGFVAANSPSQLLNNGSFSNAVDAGAFWTFFEGAYASTDGWGVSNSPCAIIPGFSGLPYAGFMQNAIAFNQTNGDFFTLTFQAKFEPNYKAGQTLVSFMNGNDTATFATVDLTDEVGPRLGQWSTYKATFRASSNNLTAMGGTNGKMSVKIQPLERTVGAQDASALIDDIVLKQQSAAAVGPQIAVKVAAATRTNGETANLFSPLVGKTTTYTVKLENQGGQDLTVSSVGLAGTGFSISGNGSSVTLAPGESKTYPLTTSPSTLGALTGTLTVSSNDKETADQNFVVKLAASPVNLSDEFSSGTPDQLGWVGSNMGAIASSSTSIDTGSLVMNVTSSDYPWSYQVSKTFASPGSLDLSSSSLNTLLRAYGKFTGTATVPPPPYNKVQVRLESLNNAGAVTGSIALGSAVDETTAGAAPGSEAYFTPDGITDRWAILLPEGGPFTSAGGTLASTGLNSTFDPNAPAFRIVLQMTDFEFDIDSGNIVQIDSINLALATKAFDLTNGSFESDATDPGTGTPPSTWSQYPVEGVSKNVVASGDLVYSASLGNLDPSVIFAAYAGTKAMKVYGQNYYPNGVWQGPSQTGTVYQEFQPGSTPGLATGTAIHARGVAKVFSIDPLTGGSTFNFGFKYLDGANIEIGRDVTSITAATTRADQWVPLTANGTVPAGAVKVQLISEFVQNASTDKGSVYLDDLSVGYGAVTTSTTIGTQNYRLVWSDEFDGSALNSANWTPELGAGGWGNNEQQTYTSNTNNLRVESGNVVIDALKSGGNWTSARIKTQDKRSFKYGLIEFRAKLPSGVGPWPAAWMMGTNISTGGWPACGEIDVMEWRGNGSDANTVGQATHSTSRNGGNPIEVSPRPTVSSPSTTYHTYGVLWEAGKVTFRVDGVTTGTWASPDSPTFEKEFFLLLNLAMGGSYVNNTIDSSLTSARYSVDYVRVFQTEATGPSAPATPTFSSVTSTGFTVNWGAVSGATSYRLDVSSSSSFASYTTQDLTVSGTSQAVTGLSPGTTYYARVRAVNSSGTSTSSPNGTQATLTAYQQYLQTAGISTSTAFGADGNGDGIPEGIKYSFGAALPMAGSTAAKVSVAGSTVTYAFDLRDDATLVVEPWFSGDLSSAWTKLVSGQNGYSGMSTTQGVAPQGFVRKTVTFTTPYTSKTFLHLKVNQQ